ncbi:MAG: peptidylprolyl isomerase [Pseudomonadota bacterium]
MKLIIASLAAVVLVHAAHAQQSQYAPDTVIAQLGDASLTLRDVDAMASQLPIEVRAGVFDNPKRIGESLETMLVRRAMVTPVLADPPPYLDLESIDQQVRRKTLINHALNNALAKQPTPDFRGRAEAQYDANPEQFKLPATVSVRHVLIGTEGRSPATAFSLASRLRDELVAGTLSFDDAVANHSDDPARNQNKGRYPRMGPGQMVRPFEAAAFSLGEPGDISEPVRSQYGYHVILLEDKHPPEQQPRESAVQLLSSRFFQEHMRTRKGRYLRSLGPDAEQKLLTRAQEGQLDQSKDFLPRFQLALEEAVLRAYKANYLAEKLVGDYEALAREYYLTHKDEFQRPAEISAVQIELTKSDDEIADLATLTHTRRLAESVLGSQFVLAFTPPTVTAQQVVYLEGDSQTARATRRAAALKQPGQCAETLEVSSRYLMICLLRKHPVLPQSFAEVQGSLVARLKGKKESQLWTLHINEFHQLPFQADPQVVASLRTRYATGPYAG